MAPEIVRQKFGYAFPADWWCVGIFAYECLTGTTPFASDVPTETYHLILESSVSWPEELQTHAEKNGHGFVEKLLENDPIRRPPRHQWRAAGATSPELRCATSTLGVALARCHRVAVRPTGTPCHAYRAHVLDGSSCLASPRARCAPIHGSRRATPSRGSRSSTDRSRRRLSPQPPCAFQEPIELVVLRSPTTFMRADAAAAHALHVQGPVEEVCSKNVAEYSIDEGPAEYPDTFPNDKVTFADWGGEWV
jgi:serine/threonine protein kinase